MPLSYMTYGIMHKSMYINVHVESCTKEDQNTSDMADHIGEMKKIK